MCLSRLFVLMCTYGWIYAELSGSVLLKEMILLMKIITLGIEYGEQLHLNCAIIQTTKKMMIGGLRRLISTI